MTLTFFKVNFSKMKYGNLKHVLDLTIFWIKQRFAVRGFLQTWKKETPRYDTLEICIWISNNNIRNLFLK